MSPSPNPADCPFAGHCGAAARAIPRPCCGGEEARGTQAPAWPTCTAPRITVRSYSLVLQFQARDRETECVCVRGREREVDRPTHIHTRKHTYTHTHTLSLSLSPSLLRAELSCSSSRGRSWLPFHVQVVYCPCLCLVLMQSATVPPLFFLVVPTLFLPPLKFYHHRVLQAMVSTGTGCLLWRLTQRPSKGLAHMSFSRLRCGACACVSFMCTLTHPGGLC